MKQLASIIRASACTTRSGLGLLAVLLVAPLLIACSVSDQPDGWAAPSPDPISPDTRLITPTGEDQVASIELIDGNLGAALWHFPDDDGAFPGLDEEIEPLAFYADPIWAPSTDEWLLAGYADGVLYAVRRDGESARILFDSEDRIVADLVLDGDRVYVADTGYRVYAIDIEQPTGAVWTWDGNSDLQIWGGPVLADTEQGRLLILAGLDGRVTALHVDGNRTGEPAWQIQLQGGVAGGLASADGVVYVGALDRTFSALDAATGNQVWSIDASHWLWGTPLVHNGVVYATDLRGQVYAWDARSGAMRWQQPFKAEDRIRSQPLLLEIDDETAILVLVARAGMIHQLDAATGTPLRQFQLEKAKDLMANGILRDDRILISDEDGSLYAVLLGANRAVQLYSPD